MDTQKNLMMFSIIISVVYGIWAIFCSRKHNEHLWSSGRIC